MIPYTLDHYVSSSQGTQLIPQSCLWQASGLFEDLRPFDRRRYREEIHAPLEVMEGNGLDQEYQRCLDMPLRLAGSRDYHLPAEWAPLAPLLQRLIGIEHAHNPNWIDYHTYMTIDCSQIVPGLQQRHGGLHVDGFQGARIQPKHRITRNYVVTTNGGTRFYPYPFIAELNDERYNIFQGFDLQREIHGYKAWTATEGMVYFMDAYTVHESGFASHPGLRTFLRLTYDIKPFDRAGNTHNALLEYDWEMVARDVHTILQAPTYADIFAAELQE